MQHATLTDTKGYGPAWSIERSVKEQSVKETNKQLDNIQWLCVCINTSKIIKYNLEFLLTLSGQDIVHYTISGQVILTQKRKFPKDFLTKLDTYLDYSKTLESAKEKWKMIFGFF